MKKKILIRKIGKTSIIPLSMKIMAVFILMLLLSNFTTNYINVLLNQFQVVELTNQILVKDLKEIYNNAITQSQLYKFTNDRESAIDSIKTVASDSFRYKNSLALGVFPNGELLFEKSNSDEKITFFEDKEILEEMKNSKDNCSIIFELSKGKYRGVYKFCEEWDAFFIRAELINDTTEESYRVFGKIIIFIIFIVLFFVFCGSFLLNHILRFIGIITDNLYEMQQKQKIELINMQDAPNDDVTYLGISFNSLAYTINNLLGIFQKFVSKDVVNKAYKEHEIRLEGTQKNLTILFSDIKSFTYMTETLGNDIISLLNIHYKGTIKAVHNYKGTIGSIIGDAILAVYGLIDENKNKSLCALQTAFSITEVTKTLRDSLIERKKQIETERELSETEKSIFDAVLINVGVGIDGGIVFYGNIGSDERMTNTVIGDNVNSASRLEGLTRIYKLPVIVSEYVKNEIESISSQYMFFEIDTVLVKGKTEGKKIYYPIDLTKESENTIDSFNIFEKALKEYYIGNWSSSSALMKQCSLEVAEIFTERMKSEKPENWSGIWTMATK